MGGNPLSIRDKFHEFYYANPHVYWRLRELAVDLKHRGRDRYSINGLFEVLRWEHAMKTSGDTFKLNNNYRALYARALMNNEPELEGFFETRSAPRSEEEW